MACAYALIQIARALLARRWPTVEGEIVDARMVHLSSGQAGSDLDRVVTYRYHVAGRPYSNNRVSFGLQPTPATIIPVHGTSASIDSPLTADYPRGKPVRVYYNPRRPEESVLHPTPNFRVWFILAGGLYAAYAAFHGAF
ncbi:MAG: DUF3592 domain-containing protein [Gemmatimonadaceae bacterium]